MILITFGYKNKAFTIVRAAIAIILGALLLSVDGVVGYITQILGVAIIIAGLVCLLPVLLSKDKTERNRKASVILASITCGVATIVGIWFVLSPDSVDTVLFTVFGAGLILMGALELLVLISTYLFIKPKSFLGWIPFILGVAAIILAITFFLNRSHLKWILAAGLVVYGVSELISMFRVSKAEAEYEIRYTEEHKAEMARKELVARESASTVYDSAKDVDYESVDRQ